MRIVFEVWTALQQLFQQTTESARFDALQRLASGTLRLEERGSAEIAEQAFARWVDQQIMGVQIAMQDAALMQVRERRGGATGNPQRLPHGKGSILGVAIACAPEQRRRTSQGLERRTDKIHQQARRLTRTE